MKNIVVESLGPIHQGNINFGDLTLFVGPHASGKSILLQMIKLLVDKDQIRRTTEQYGYVWGNTVDFQQALFPRSSSSTRKHSAYPILFSVYARVTLVSL